MTTPIRARLMSRDRHLLLQFGGQLVTVLLLGVITAIVWFLDGEPAGFPWRTLLIVAILGGPILAYIGFRLAAPFIMCRDCRAIGYVDDLRRLKRCPACGAESFYWLFWSARPNPWQLKDHRPAAAPGRIMSATQVIEKGDRMNALARSFTRLD
jgi:hypothetical protein